METSVGECSCRVVGEYVATTCRGSVEAHKARNVAHIPLHEIVEATGCGRPCYIIDTSATPIDVCYGCDSTLGCDRCRTIDSCCRNDRLNPDPWILKSVGVNTIDLQGGGGM